MRDSTFRRRVWSRRLAMNQEAGELGAVGDLVVVESRRVGGGRRKGEIVEVLVEAGRERCRVRWEDGRETDLYLGSSAATTAKLADRTGEGSAPLPATAPEPDYEGSVLVHEP
jgi:hypothetical protein